jgi:hypothetical protein
MIVRLEKIAQTFLHSGSEDTWNSAYSLSVIVYFLVLIVYNVNFLGKPNQDGNHIKKSISTRGATKSRLSF